MDQLHDAYMQFVDLQDKCKLDLKASEIKPVLYIKPEGWQFQDPDSQQKKRAEIIDNLSKMPPLLEPESFQNELYNEMQQSVTDQSSPQQTKHTLISFYENRLLQLQLLQQKLLQRWAHYTLTSAALELNTPEATFVCGKVQFSIEQTMSRLQRLKQPDYYDQAVQTNRPSTQLQDQQLYIENLDIPAQSVMREDDIEVYLRSQCWVNKCSQQINIFVAKLKFMGEQQEIYRDAVVQHQQGKSVDNKMFIDESDRLKFGWKASGQVPLKPVTLQDLKAQVTQLASRFNLTGDIDLDQGHAFVYQINVFFPLKHSHQQSQCQFNGYDAPGQHQHNLYQQLSGSASNMQFEKKKPVKLIKNQIRPTHLKVEYDMDLLTSKLLSILDLTDLTEVKQFTQDYNQPVVPITETTTTVTDQFGQPQTVKVDQLPYTHSQPLKPVPFTDLTLPSHLVQALTTLQYLLMKDHSIKLLYCFNYYESISKRLFWSDKIADDSPYIIPKESSLPFIKQPKPQDQFSQWPQHPAHHVANGHPVSTHPQQEHTNISHQSYVFIGKQDFIEISDLVYVKDDFGIYIMYDTAQQVLHQHYQYLLQVASHYIRKSENINRPIRDRLQVLVDLLDKDAQYQELKVQIIQCYMECYEHVTIPEQQSQLVTLIQQMVCKQARLDLNANYFTHNYDSEIQSLQSQLKLLQLVIDQQVTIEKRSNHQLQSYLRLSYKLTNTYKENKYQYQQIGQLSKQVAQELDGGIFNDLLGVQQVTLQSLFESQVQDHKIVQLMQQEDDFIHKYEGYPEFLGISQTMFQFNAWSQATGVLDFYSTLGVVCEITNTIQTLQQACYKEHYNSEIDHQINLRAIVLLQSLQTRDLIINDSDRLLYYTKQQIHDLNCKPKFQLNPKIVQCLDLQTIKSFNFDQFESQQDDWVESVAKLRVDQLNQQVQLNRNMYVPSLLQAYCNLVELVRLHGLLQKFGAQADQLQIVYNKQMKACGYRGQLFSNTQLEPVLCQYQDFSDIDAIRVNVTDCGLEQTRACLQMQLVVKQQLQVTNTLNYKLISHHLDNQVRLDLISQKISVQNAPLSQGQNQKELQELLEWWTEYKPSYQQEGRITMSNRYIQERVNSANAVLRVNQWCQQQFKIVQQNAQKADVISACSYLRSLPDTESLEIPSSQNIIKHPIITQQDPKTVIKMEIFPELTIKSLLVQSQQQSQFGQQYIQLQQYCYLTMFIQNRVAQPDEFDLRAINSLKRKPDQQVYEQIDMSFDLLPLRLKLLKSLLISSMLKLSQKIQLKHSAQLQKEYYLLKQEVTDYADGLDSKPKLESAIKYLQQFSKHMLLKEYVRTRTSEIQFKQLQIESQVAQPDFSPIAALIKQLPTLVTDKYQSQQKLIDQLQQEYKIAKLKVINSVYHDIKSGIQVYTEFLNQQLIQQSVGLINEQCSAISKCFQTLTPSNPNQFACTFFDQIDPNKRFDISNHIPSIQDLLTQIKNRCTLVETLTSGPAVVISIKDMNQILQQFCQQSVIEQSEQYQSRMEAFQQVEQHYREMLYLKDQQIEQLKRVPPQHPKIEPDLLYRLNQAQRVIKQLSHQLKLQETVISEKILSEQQNKFDRKTLELKLANERFEDYKAYISNVIQVDFEKDSLQINQVLRQQTANSLEEKEDSLKTAEVLRQQKIFYRMREVLLRQKYIKQIEDLQSKQADNQLLWGQYQQLQLQKQDKPIAVQQQQVVTVVVKQPVKKKVYQFQYPPKEDQSSLEVALVTQGTKNKVMQRQIVQHDQQLSKVIQQHQKEVERLQKIVAQQNQRYNLVLDELNRFKAEHKVLEAQDPCMSMMWKNKCVELQLELNQIKRPRVEYQTQSTKLVRSMSQVIRN